MFNIADIIVMLIMLIAIFSGYKKGFIKTSFGVLSFFIAIAITFMFYKPVMGMLEEKTTIREWLTEYLYSIDLNEKTLEDGESGEVLVVATESGDSYIDKLPQSVVDMIGLEEAKENAKTVVVQKIVDFVVKLLAIIIVYMVAKILLAIVVLVLDSIASLPVLKQFNELLGLGLGAILGLIQVYVLCAIITLISSMPIAEGIPAIINNSLFAHVLYNNNLLLEILF